MIYKNETAFTGALLRELRKLPDSYWWRNNVGRRGGVSFGDPHSPDLEGIMRGGRFVGVECKAPGELPTDAQTRWHRRALELGATIVVIDSYELVDAVRRIYAEVMRSTSTTLTSAGMVDPK